MCCTLHTSMHWRLTARSAILQILIAMAVANFVRWWHSLNWNRKYRKSNFWQRVFRFVLVCFVNRYYSSDTITTKSSRSILMWRLFVFIRTLFTVYGNAVGVTQAITSKKCNIFCKKIIFNLYHDVWTMHIFD